MTKEESNTIYVMKAFAILSVIAAHVNMIEKGNFNLIKEIWDKIGLLGVICFFILGGYLFKPEKNLKNLLSKKFLTIIVPWIFATIVSYIFHCIKIGDFSIFGYLKWFIGFGTIYYYMTNYFIFLLIFNLVKGNKIFIYICLLVTVIQSIMNVFINFASIFSYFGIYLNIFNWIGLFALGMLLREHNVFSKITKKIYVIISLILFIIMFYIMITNRIYGYFHFYSLIFELAGFAVIYFLSHMLSNNKLLIFAGKISFTIYLFHIQIVQKICWNLPSNNILYFLNPLIGLLSMIVIIWVGINVAKRLKHNKLIFSLVGLNGREVL